MEEKENEKLKQQNIDYAKFNYKLQKDLNNKKSETVKLKQLNQDYAVCERLNSELQEKLIFEEKEKEKLKQQNLDYAKFNYELRKEMSAEKSETDVLKQRIKELERRIAMLHNADNVSEFEQDNSTTIKNEYIKTELKPGTEK